jgi:UDP-N-acetylglucosamine acyltransferase
MYPSIDPACGNKEINMATTIHPSSVVSPGAEIGEDCTVDPFVIIDDDTVIGDGNRIGPGTHVRRHSRIGNGNTFSGNCCIGYEPQNITLDPDNRGGVVIGDGNTFREFCTVHRSTEHPATVVGDNGLFMVNSHIAHDCVVGDRVTMINNSVLAGFVELSDHAVLSAYVAIHQYCRVGRYAMVGAYSKIVQDVVPFTLVDGNPARVYGTNTVGLRRASFSTTEKSTIKKAIRAVCRAPAYTKSALEALEAELADNEYVMEIVRFVAGSRRGIIR